MQCMSARDAKNSFGKLIDIARAEPVAIEKHGRAVVVVLSIESYERLRAGREAPARTKTAGRQESGGLQARQAGAGKTAKKVEES